MAKYLKNYKEDKVLVCSDVNFKIQKGDKVSLLGQEGKKLTKFIYTLMGETDLKEGSIQYKGKIIFADADESMFIMGESLRENILMGEEYIHMRYQKVLKVVGLDINKFMGGDCI